MKTHAYNFKKIRPRKIVEYLFSKEKNDFMIDKYLLHLDKLKEELEKAKNDDKVVKMKFLFDPSFKNCFGQEIICRIIKVFNSYVIICPPKDPFHGHFEFDKKMCQCIMYFDAERYLNEVIL